MMCFMSVSRETVVSLWTGMRLPCLLRGPWMPGIGWVNILWMNGSRCLCVSWSEVRRAGWDARWSWKKSPASEDEDQAEAVGGGVSVSRLLCREDSDPSPGPEDNWRGDWVLLETQAERPEEQQAGYTEGGKWEKSPSMLAPALTLLVPSEWMALDKATPLDSVSCRLKFPVLKVTSVFKKRVFKNVDRFKILHWICYNIASVLCFRIFFFFFGFKAYGISATQPGVEPACPCTGRVLTTGPLGEAPGVGFLMSRAWRSSTKGWDRPEAPSGRTGRDWQTFCYTCPLTLEVTKSPRIMFRSSYFPRLSLPLCPPLPWAHVYPIHYLSGFLKLGCLEDQDPRLNPRNISIPNTESTSNLTPGCSVPRYQPWWTGQEAEPWKSADQWTDASWKFSGPNF